MAILTGKPTSISANAPSNVITLDTSEFLNLVDDVTADQYWQDVSRIKSIIFIYRNSSRQRVNLKFSLPSTSSTVPLNENYRNGALTCIKIKIIGMANDTLSIPRSSFITDTEFDMSVIDGYAVPGLQGAEAIVWSSPITTTFSTIVAEPDGGLYKNNGPDFSNGGVTAYDISVKSSQELNLAEGFIEVDAIHYSYQDYQTESEKYSSSAEYAVGFSFGERSTSGNFDNLDFAIKKATNLNDMGNPTNKNTASYLNGVKSLILSALNNPLTGPGGPGSSQPYFHNKIRIQLKNGNVEFFINNVKYQTLVGALASVTFPIFAEASLLQPYLGAFTATSGSGFPSSRISSTLSTPGTIVRTADIAGTLDSDALPYDMPNGPYMALADAKVACNMAYEGLGGYIEFGQGNLGGTLVGESFLINNIGYQQGSGTTFQAPLVEGNNYTVRLYISAYVNIGSSPTISIAADTSYRSDMVTVSSSSLQSAIGSYVDVPYTPTYYKNTFPDGTLDAFYTGIWIFSNNTTDLEYIRISKIEILEA